MNDTRPLLTYYGDDFTGSTDVMEALSVNGVPTVLFLDVPDAALLSRFAHCRAIGIAGTSRSETPEWMETHLPRPIDWLKSRGADICHYKVCSTFDSSPTVGNIGKAIEIGKTIFSQRLVPLIVGAPQLKRYTSFGTLFAAYQGLIHRIDRHPVMSRHPVTPMDEADLRLHLARQTALPAALADGVALRSSEPDRQVDALAADFDGILMLDVDDMASQMEAGRQLWRLRQAGGSFAVGSSGIEYALLAAWKAQGMLGAAESFPSPGKVDRLAVVSGSVSPMTERQIRHAKDNGFDGIDLDPLSLVGENAQTVVDQAVATGIERLKNGRSVILHTALGPSADKGSDIDRVPGARHRLGQTLGIILRRLIEAESLKRAVIAGGDTSSHALRELSVQALTMLLPLPQTPGSPLCIAHGLHAPTNGLQIALKGGQVGMDDYFVQIRDGRQQ